MSETETVMIDRTDAGDLSFARRVSPIERADPAPESFDPIAALRRVEALVEEFDKATVPALINEFDRGLVAGYARVADRIRAALAPQADQ